jgi:hypothetical protein
MPYKSDYFLLKDKINNLIEIFGEAYLIATLSLSVN